MYVKLIIPIGYQAREKNEEFLFLHAQMINKFILQFARDFCQPDGAIDWEKLVQLNSASDEAGQA